jgi:hypothetical protein
MKIEELSIFGLYSQKENKVTAALLLVWKLGWATLLRSFISSFVSFVILPIILLFRYQLRCREPVCDSTQLSCVFIFKNKHFNISYYE